VKKGKGVFPRSGPVKGERGKIPVPGGLLGDDSKTNLKSCNKRRKGKNRREKGRFLGGKGKKKKTSTKKTGSAREGGEGGSKSDGERLGKRGIHTASRERVVFFWGGLFEDSHPQ